MVQTVRVPMNRQQLELIDRTLARWPGATRSEILQRALREYTAKHAVAVVAATGAAS